MFADLHAPRRRAILGCVLPFWQKDTRLKKSQEDVEICDFPLRIALFQIFYSKKNDAPYIRQTYLYAEICLVAIVKTLSTNMECKHTGGHTRSYSLTLKAPLSDGATWHPADLLTATSPAGKSVSCLNAQGHTSNEHPTFKCKNHVCTLDFHASTKSSEDVKKQFGKYWDHIMNHIPDPHDKTENHLGMCTRAIGGEGFKLPDTLNFAYCGYINDEATNVSQYPICFANAFIKHNGIWTHDQWPWFAASTSDIFKIDDTECNVDEFKNFNTFSLKK